MYMKKIAQMAVLGLMLLIPTFVSGETVLTLEKALEIAAENSPTIVKARLSMERTKLNMVAQEANLKAKFSASLNPISFSRSRSYDEFNAAWYTSQNLGSNGSFSISQPVIWTDGTVSLTNRLSYSHSETERPGMGGATTTSTNSRWQNNLSLSLSQPIFKYNATKMNMRQLELEYENAHMNYASQMMNIERSVTQAFYSAYLAQMRLEISREEYENNLRNNELIKVKVDGGLSPREELFQADVNMLSAQSDWESTQVSFERTKDQFKQTLGMDIDEDISFAADINVDNIVEVSEEDALKYALMYRFEFRQQEINLENAEMSLIQTKANDKISGTISASVGITGDDKDLANIYHKENRTQSPQVSLSLQIPIFDWGVRKARIKSQEISMESTKIDIAEEKKTIILDVRSAVRSYENTVAQIEIAEKTAANSQLTYDLYVERYRTGDITGLQMNQYQTQLSSSKISYLQALINYKTELLALKIATMYDFEKGEPVNPLEKYKLYD